MRALSPGSWSISAICSVFINTPLLQTKTPSGLFVGQVTSAFEWIPQTSQGSLVYEGVQTDASWLGFCLGRGPPESFNVYFSPTL